MKLKHVIEIDCPREVVWTWIERPEKQKQWMKGVVSNEHTNDVEGVGATFVMKIKEGRKVSDYRGEVTAFDEPTHLAVTLTGGCMKGMTMDVDYRLTDLGGRTRVDYEAGMKTETLMLKIMSALFSWIAKLQLKSFFKTLKGLAEAEADAVPVGT